MCCRLCWSYRISSIKPFKLSCFNASILEAQMIQSPECLSYKWTCAFTHSFVQGLFTNPFNSCIPHPDCPKQFKIQYKTYTSKIVKTTTTYFEFSSGTLSGWKAIEIPSSNVSKALCQVYIPLTITMPLSNFLLWIYISCFTHMISSMQTVTLSTNT